MSKNDRKTRFVLEGLETRNLLTTLIGSKPTITVLDGPGVRHYKSGIINLLNPAPIQIYGTAQPGNANTAVTVSIFAEDRGGNIINNGQPLATTTPDFLGRYHVTVTLPSNIRKDVNFLIARQESSSTEVSQLAINATTISNLSGNLNLNPSTISGLSGTIATPTLGISGISGTISNPSTAFSGLTGTISNGPIAISGISGSISNPATVSSLTGTIVIPSFPITTPVGAGTGGPATGTLTGVTSTNPASTSTLSGGTGTLAASTGTLTTGAGTIAASTSTLSGGTGTIAAGTSSFTQSGTATLSALTGTFSNGTGDIAATTGTSTFFDQEVAVSDPLIVFIHQRTNQPGGVVAAVSVAQNHVAAQRVVTPRVSFRRHK
jgi:X-X-X-Leu-X-X-Gly heptad repeat protein